MNLILCYIPIDDAEAAALAQETDQRIRHKFTPPSGPIYAGRCAACDNELQDGERGANRGYASGLELGLCGGCTTHVNTPADIEAAAQMEASKTTESISYGRQDLASNDRKRARALQ